MLAETGGAGVPDLVPPEVKTSATATPRMARGIRGLRADLGDAVVPGYVVFMGDRRLPLRVGVTSLPLWEL